MVQVWRASRDAGAQLQFKRRHSTGFCTQNDELLLNYILPLLHIYDFQLMKEHFYREFLSRVICPFFQVPQNKDSLVTEYFSVSKTRLRGNHCWFLVASFCLRDLKGERKYLSIKQIQTFRLRSSKLHTGNWTVTHTYVKVLRIRVLKTNPPTPSQKKQNSFEFQICLGTTSAVVCQAGRRFCILRSGDRFSSAPPGAVQVCVFLHAVCAGESSASIKIQWPGEIGKNWRAGSWNS